MRYKIILLNAIIFVAVTVSSHPKQEWIQRYNGPGNSFDIVSELHLDVNDNVYVYGSSTGVNSLSDFTIIKYTSTGMIDWIQRYNSPANNVDQINSAHLDSEGNSYVSGFTTDSNFVNNITTAKYNSSGSLIWMNVYKRAGYTNGFGQDISLDNEGSVLVTGFIKNLQSTYDIITIKYLNNGVQTGSVIYNGIANGDDIPVAVRVNNFNDVIIGGYVKTINNNSDMFLASYDSSLNLNWTKTFNGTANNDDKIFSISLDQDDNVYFCGGMINKMSSSDYFYAKLNSKGSIIWTGTYNRVGNSFDAPSSMTIDSFNNIYITGLSRSASMIGTENILTLKIGTNGSVLWSEEYNGSANGADQGNAIEVDNSGNVYIGGASDRGNLQFTYALLKYDSSGLFRWSANYSLANVPEDFIYDVKLDKSNNIYVTGISLDTINDYDFVTIKYSQSVGINEISGLRPDEFFLSQNYPNPFNPSTVIDYVLGENAVVKLKVYDVTGREVAILENGFKPKGKYSVKLDVNDYKNLSSGFFYYMIEAGDFTGTKKMIFIK